MLRGPLLPPRTWAPAVAILLLTIAAGAALTTGWVSASAHPAGPSFAPGCTQLEKFKADDFPERPKIHNTYLPLIPGIRTVFEGNVDGVPHRVEFTVTDLAKKVNGVNVLVVWVTDTSEGRLVESELSFFAEDEDGNVWSLGEYPEEYEYDENGELVDVSAPSTWIAGKSAEPGIQMADRPIVSSRQYIQGEAAKIDFLDCAKVVEETRNRKVCVEFACFSGVVVTHETNLAVPGDGIQSKYHAPGKGVVKIGAVDPPTGEVLELVARERIRGPQWQAALRAALELDARGYDLGAHGGYGHTTPAKRLPPKR